MSERTAAERDEDRRLLARVFLFVVVPPTLLAYVRFFFPALEVPFAGLATFVRGAALAILTIFAVPQVVTGAFELLELPRQGVPPPPALPRPLPLWLFVLGSFAVEGERPLRRLGLGLGVVLLPAAVLVGLWLSRNRWVFDAASRDVRRALVLLTEGRHDTAAALLRTVRPEALPPGALLTYENGLILLAFGRGDFEEAITRADVAAARAAAVTSRTAAVDLAGFTYLRTSARLALRRTAEAAAILEAAVFPPELAEHAWQERLRIRRQRGEALADGAELDELATIAARSARLPLFQVLAAEAFAAAGRDAEARVLRRRAVVLYGRFRWLAAHAPDQADLVERCLVEGAGEAA